VQKLALEWDGEGRNRTGDTTIFSRVLYQLSYLARKPSDGSGGRCGWRDGELRTVPSRELM
jgi:hypothetical protein